LFPFVVYLIINLQIWREAGFSGMTLPKLKKMKCGKIEEALAII
tara:strand:+ start:623 stop:754 length:132 start_codon:yes stop_codon:yes gene_type:complete